MGLTAVHFGGGNIGRGFVAEKLCQSGYEVVFVDVVDKLIESLQSTPSYTVTEIGSEGSKVNTISNYRAINSKTHESDAVCAIASADLVTCAVGPNILKFIAPVIGKGIDARTSTTPVAVIACENMIGATDKLASFIRENPNTPIERLETLSHRARFANSAIDRIVPAQDADAGLNVKIETFYEWIVDKTPFAPHQPPQVTAIKWVENLEPYIERKLFTVNTGHATAAYYGHARGKKTIAEAMQDAEIHRIVHECLAETSSLIVNKHGIGAQEQRDYVDKIIKRISNPMLVDIVERVGRAPLRKLGRQERFVGPAAHLAAEGQSYSALLAAMAQAFQFIDVDGDDESRQLGDMLRSSPADMVVKDVCGLTPDDALYSSVVDVVSKVQAKIKG